MDKFRELLGCIFASIFGTIAPIHDILIACMLVFAINFVAGVSAGVFKQHEGFAFKKAFNCILEGMVISSLIAFVLIIGDKIDNHEGAMSAISIIVYALIYFYGVNTLKNLTRIFPKSKLFDFLYYVLSFEVIKNLPYLENYRNHKNTKQ